MAACAKPGHLTVEHLRVKLRRLDWECTRCAVEISGTSCFDETRPALWCGINPKSGLDAIRLAVLSIDESALRLARRALSCGGRIGDN